MKEGQWSIGVKPRSRVESSLSSATVRAFGYSSCDMDWADYLRDEAAKFRQLAETAEDPSTKQELLDLAAVCEEVANNIEDRIPGG